MGVLERDYGVRLGRVIGVGPRILQLRIDGQLAAELCLTTVPVMCPMTGTRHWE